MSTEIFLRYQHSAKYAPHIILQEAVRVKRLGSRKSAIRDVLFNAVADYKRQCTSKVGLAGRYQE